MSDQSPADADTAASATEPARADNTDGEHEHDCQDHLQFVEYEWLDDCWDDIFECSMCGAEYRAVYGRAFLLDGDDYSLVEEYTDDIEDRIEHHRNDGNEGCDDPEDSDDA